MRPWFKFVADLIAEEPDKAAEILEREMKQVPEGLLQPFNPDPGAFWYKITYGLFEGWWINIDHPNIVMYHHKNDWSNFGVHVILSHDAEMFEKENPDWSADDFS